MRIARVWPVVARTPVVGRAPELAALTARLEGAIAGHGGIALLAGEPGIGKTRLAEELAAIAHDRGMRVLWGRCHEGEGAPAFWPWVEVLRACCAGYDAEALHAALGVGATDIAHLVPDLGGRLPDLPAPPALEPAARFRLFESVTILLTEVAARQPLLLILDDLH